jgi:rRNA maturation endonuclease Nob1
MAETANLIDPQLDSNFLIRLQQGEQMFVDYATRNRSAGLSVYNMVLTEFLQKGTIEEFMALQGQYGIRLANDFTPNEVSAVAARLRSAFGGTGRVLSTEDARVLATAFLQREKFATGDLQLFKRATDLGLDVDFIGTGNAVTKARNYVPQPVQIAPEATNS